MKRSVIRLVAAALGTAMAIAAVPAQAQFFFKSHDLSAPPVKGDEPGFIPLPGGTPAELRASLVWHMRAAMNYAALQCQFEPTLLSVDNYNDVFRDHRAELDNAYATLTKYFQRVNKAPKAAQTALDSYGTQVYSSFSTATPYMFCQTAASMERDALFTPRGQLYTVAEKRMQELRNSLVPWGEQQFPRGNQFNGRVSLPSLDARCYDKKAAWNGKCGPYTLYER
ncbi:hypothetical protein [Sphingomonas aracearum]|uniref:hypothetical protein n=1 Tax=Sphingomonas aracearum TaxID=2283317 RepID=UPI003B833677